MADYGVEEEIEGDGASRTFGTTRRPFHNRTQSGMHTMTPMIAPTHAGGMFLEMPTITVQKNTVRIVKPMRVRGFSARSICVSSDFF